MPSSSRSGVGVVIEAQAGDREGAGRLYAYVEEHPSEGEHYDALLHQPWRVVVQTVRAGVGLSPDWSQWDTVTGPAHDIRALFA